MNIISNVRRRIVAALTVSVVIAVASAVLLLWSNSPRWDLRTAGHVDERGSPADVRAIGAAVARIAAESSNEGPLAPAVERAPRHELASRPATIGDEEARPAAPTGYSFIEHRGQMPTSPIPAVVATEPIGDGPVWMGSPEAVSRLVAQADAAGRDWAFGWIRRAEGTPPDDLVRALDGTHAEVLGSAGRLVRARLPADAVRLEAIAALPSVDALGALPPEAKLRWYADGPGANPSVEPQPVFVTLMADDAGRRWRDELEDLGAVVGSYDRALRMYRANVRPQVLEALAAADFVLAVEPVGIVEAAHDTALPAMGADALRVHDGEGIFSGTGGASVPIGVLDTGLNVNHRDISTHRDSICGASFVANGSLGGAREAAADLWFDQNGHGTHITGTIIGNGAVERRFAGMAPSVRYIRFAKVLDRNRFGDQDSVLRGMDYLAEGGCGDSGHITAQVPLVVNMSLSATSTASAGRGGTSERKLDAMVWGNRQIYVVGQGNWGDRGFSAYAAAKNSLAVGAALDSGELAAFSSRGPTADGRMTPNVVATGVSVRSAKGAGSLSGYKRFHGTSTASSSVAGAAALLMDALPAHRRHPALIRARLMASAVRPDVWLEDPAAFPLDNSNGPGALQAGYGMGKVSARSSILDRDGPDGWTSGSAAVVVGDGEFATQQIVVAEGTHRLDLVLTWDEPPAEAIGQTVLNDLDLWLDRDGDCGGAACGERNSSSRIDNVEWIIVRDPEPGTYAAKVVASRVHGAPPRAALAWTAIRGESTPTLSVAADRTALDATGRHNLTLTVTVDAYLAAGARLHVDCDDPSGEKGCDHVTFESMAISREDGVNLTKDLDIACAREDCAVDSVAFGASIPLGEVAAGESQEVTFGIAVDGEPGSARLHFTASAWNAESGSVTIGIGTGAGEQDDPVPPANDGFADAVVLEGEEGVRELDLLLAGTEPGEPPFELGSADVGKPIHPGRPAGSVWYLWTAPSNGAFRFRLAAPDSSVDHRSHRVDVYTGDSIAALGRAGSGGFAASMVGEQGTTYRIRVSNFMRGDHLEFHWSRLATPANDDFVGATVLSGVRGTVKGTTVGATLEANESLGDLVATTWYRWTAPDDGAWDFWTTADSAAVQDLTLRPVAVFVADDIASRRLVGNKPDATIYFRARRGTEYRFVVALRDESDPTGEYELHWAPSTRQLDGDTFAQAVPIDGDASGTHDVRVDRNSRLEPGEAEETGVRTSWWVWEAPTDDVYTWRLARSGTNAVELQLAGLTGTGEPTLADLEVLGQTDPGGSSSFQLSANGGQRYWLAVGFAARSSGAYRHITAEAALDWGPAPDNDEVGGALALTGASGSFVGSNRHATAMTGPKSETLGNSTLWWTYEAPEAGWVRFAVAEPGSWVLTVHGRGADGGLEVVASSRWQAPGRLDGETGTQAVRFNARPGVTYTISLGTGLGGTGSDFTLEWGEAEVPGWLRYAGRLLDGDRNADGDPVEIRDPASMAVHASGSPLYLASSIGLQVFERDPATGGLDFLQLLDGDLRRGGLHWDTHRDRLLAADCGVWQAFAQAADSLRLEDGSELAVADEPGRCGDELVMDSGGSFVYRIGDGHVDLYSIDDAGNLGFTESYETAGVMSAVLDDGRDRLYALTEDQLLVFDKDGETGSLTRRDAAPVVANAQALAITDDGAYLFVLDRGGEQTIVYALGEEDPRRLAGIERFWRPADPDNECRFAALRDHDFVIDAFCRSAVFRAHWKPEDQTIEGTDYIAHDQPDRFGNPVPDFDFPTAMAASPDRRHVYLSTPHEGVLIFTGPEEADVDDPGAPDLSIQSQWASDTGPVAGTAFTLSAVIRNRGAGASAPTTIRAYRSEDAAITTADAEIGSVGFDGLAAGRTRSQSITVPVPAEPGMFRYGLCVDAEEGESDTSNNCSGAVTINVVEDPRVTDLVVDSPAVSTGQPGPGATFTLSARVVNQGDLEADASTLRYYRSADAAIDADDTEVGTAAIAGLAASATSIASIDLVAPREGGTYYYGACVDFVAGEADTSNNCSDAVGITVAVPDLAVVFSASDVEVDPEATITLEAIVRNEGTRTSSRTTLRYYRSDDDEISALDSEIGSRLVDELPAGASSAQSIEVQAPLNPGTVYYGACVDADPTESETGNNCSSAGIVTVVQTACSAPLHRGSRLPPTVALDPAALVDTRVGTAEEPFVQAGSIEDAADFDGFRIVLDRAVRLKIKAEQPDDSDSPHDDTQGVLVSENCAPVGNMWHDAEWHEDYPGGDLNIYFIGNLAPGTYYLGVGGWSGATGEYELHVWAEDQPDNEPPELGDLNFDDIATGREVWRHLETRDDDGDWISSVSAESSNPDIASVETGVSDLRVGVDTLTITEVFVTGVAEGTTTVTVTAEDQRGASASRNVEVTVFAPVEGACDVVVSRGRDRPPTVELRPAALVDTSVGTAEEPFVQAGSIDDEADFDGFRIVLDRAVQLKIKAEEPADSDSPHDDTQGSMVRADDCKRVGNTWNDAEWHEDYESGDWNIYFIGNMAPGTYYLAVGGWAGATGDYELRLWAEDQPDNDPPVLDDLDFPDIATGTSVSRTLVMRDDDGDWIDSVSSESSNPEIATVRLGGLGYNVREDTYYDVQVNVDGVAEGTTTITLSAEDQRGASASREVEVTVTR